VSAKKTTEPPHETRIKAKGIVRQVRIKGGAPQVQIDLTSKLTGDDLAELTNLTRVSKGSEPPHVWLVMGMSAGPLFDPPAASAPTSAPTSKPVKAKRAAGGKK